MCLDACYFFYEVYAFAVRGKLSIIRNNFHAEILALNARTFSLTEVFFLCALHLGYESSNFPFIDATHTTLKNYVVYHELLSSK